jgi:PPOX class probable F420-dependent enzyme
MTVTIPDSHADLVDGPVYVTLTTVMPDGQPQSSVVWWDREGEYIRVNTARGRQKEKNMNRNAKVTILALDPKDPYRWLEVRGTIEEITEDGGVEHIELLSQKYRGRGYYIGEEGEKRRQQETRVKVLIRPTRVITH